MPHEGRAIEYTKTKIRQNPDGEIFSQSLFGGKPWFNDFFYWLPQWAV
jgi:hypothetical protein